MKKLWLLLAASLLTFSVVAEDVAVKDEPIVVGHKKVLKSKVLGEDRPYFVHLPGSYHEAGFQPQNYPVLYILDGSVSFHPATGVVNHMSSPLNNGNIQIPELIVVAIPNTTDRTRDLTPTHTLKSFDGKESPANTTSGGGDKFLQFVKTELIPQIDSDYRTMPHRTFVGHSLGGLTVLHSLLSQPGLFQNYIAIDSSLWWDDRVLNTRIEQFSADNPVIKANVFVSLAEHKVTGFGGGSANMIVGNMEFVELMEKHAPGINIKLRTFAGEDHGSVPLLSLYNGLLHVFEGHKPSVEQLMANPESLVDHFKAFSERAGVEFLPPEQMMNMMAQFLAAPGAMNNAEKAKKLLEINAANYPESEAAKKALADFLKAQK